MLQNLIIIDFSSPGSKIFGVFPIKKYLFISKRREGFDCLLVKKIYKMYSILHHSLINGYFI